MPLRLLADALRLTLLTLSAIYALGIRGVPL